MQERSESGTSQADGLERGALEQGQKESGRRLEMDSWEGELEVLSWERAWKTAGNLVYFGDFGRLVLLGFCGLLRMYKNKLYLEVCF